MTDNLEGILRRVASGELSVEEAEPLIAAASGEPGTLDSGPVRKTGRFGWPRFSGPGGDASAASSDESSPPGAIGARRVVRLQVMEGGRSVVNLRIPMSLAGLAGSVLPGLSNEHADRLREAIRSGTVGRILEVQDEDGDGVIISTE
jgi:hypothetical protein